MNLSDILFIVDRFTTIDHAYRFFVMLTLKLFTVCRVIGCLCLSQNEEFYVCIYSQRQGDTIMFHHEGGVEIGDVDAKVNACRNDVLIKCTWDFVSVMNECFVLLLCLFVLQLFIWPVSAGIWITVICIYFSHIECLLMYEMSLLYELPLVHFLDYICVLCTLVLQCFDTVGWASGKASGL